MPETDQYGWSYFLPVLHHTVNGAIFRGIRDREYVQTKPLASGTPAQDNRLGGRWFNVSSAGLPTSLQLARLAASASAVRAGYSCHIQLPLVPQCNSNLFRVLYGTAFPAAWVYSLSQIHKLTMSPIGLWTFGYLLFAIGAIIQTEIDLGPIPAAYGGARLLLTVPLAAMVMLVTGIYPRLFEYALWLFLIFTVIGIFSILIQYLTGPISWFVEASDRVNAGMERFEKQFLNDIAGRGSGSSRKFY